MAYQISSISGCSPDEHPLYFFDANVWLAVLKHTGSKPIGDYERAYVDFFEAVVELHMHPPKLQKKLKHVPRLVMTSLLLSEILNAYMRQVAFRAYQKTNPAATDFKRHYRSTADYQQQLRAITSDIQSYSEYIELIDDDFVRTDPLGLLSMMQSDPARYDFNDLFYYRSLRAKQVVIVTHDGDFAFNDISIFTANQKLLSLR